MGFKDFSLLFFSSILISTYLVYTTQITRRGHEQIAHGHSFVKSDLSDSLMVGL